jgi:hypothetical protein
LLAFKATFLPISFSSVLFYLIAHFAFSVHFTVFPLALIDLSVRKFAYAITIFFAILEVSCVSSFISILDCALSMVTELEKFTFIVLQIIFEDVPADPAENVVTEPAY